MKCRILCLSFFVSSFSALFSLSPPPLTQTLDCKPISTLLSSTPVQDAVWIQGKVISREEDDVYLLSDDSGTIHIFLCLDDLASLTLTPGEKVAVWGKVDKSPLGQAHNEFYVEKIFDIPTQK